MLLTFPSSSFGHSILSSHGPEVDVAGGFVLMMLLYDTTITLLHENFGVRGLLLGAAGMVFFPLGCFPRTVRLLLLLLI